MSKNVADKLNINQTESEITNLRYSKKVDSQGNTLSAEQQNYFKDSKVLDENGNLRVVYHGSMADFTIFDLNQARDTEDIEAFFFSGDYDESNGYANTVVTKVTIVQLNTTI